MLRAKKSEVLQGREASGLEGPEVVGVERPGDLACAPGVLAVSVPQCKRTALPEAGKAGEEVAVVDGSVGTIEQNDVNCGVFGVGHSGGRKRIAVEGLDGGTVPVKSGKQDRRNPELDSTLLVGGTEEDLRHPHEGLRADLLSGAGVRRQHVVAFGLSAAKNAEITASPITRTGFSRSSRLRCRTSWIARAVSSDAF